MHTAEMPFQVRLATDERDLLGAQRLRYRVFVEELGGDGPLVDHAARLERDAFDPFYDHMILVDPARDDGGIDHVVAVYRLMPGDRAEAAGGFYTAGEYDLSPLVASGRNLLELGRSCVRAEYRGGPAMYLMWNALADYTLARGIEVLFGVASFHGTDVAELAALLALGPDDIALFDCRRDPWEILERCHAPLPECGADYTVALALAMSEVPG